MNQKYIVLRYLPAKFFKNVPQNINPATYSRVKVIRLPVWFIEIPVVFVVFASNPIVNLVPGGD